MQQLLVRIAIRGTKGQKQEFAIEMRLVTARTNLRPAPSAGKPIQKASFRKRYHAELHVVTAMGKAIDRFKRNLSQIYTKSRHFSLVEHQEYGSKLNQISQGFTIGVVQKTKGYPGELWRVTRTYELLSVAIMKMGRDFKTRAQDVVCL